MKKILKNSCFILAASVCLAAPIAAQNTATPNTSMATRAWPDFADLVDRASPAVVNIRTTEKVSARQANPGFPGMDEEQAEFFRRFFGIPIPTPRQQPNQPRRNAPQEEQNRGVGSGFIIESNGFILTNAHVVEGADTIYVTLTDKREFKAKLIGADKRTDVALVKIDAVGLPKLTIGDSGKLRVGEWVLAIGSPFGLENSVTAGIVSAKSRDTGDYLPFIQTDVAVNPGNSGGPLLNTRGEVIGINSQIFSRSGGYMGISFAIPIDEAMRISSQLRANGRVTRGRIGVAIAEVNKDLAESLGLGKPRGAYVRNVEAGAPAEKAGVEAGDVILAFNDRPIEKSSDLPRIVGETKPGTRSTLTVWRKGAQRDLSVTVADVEPAEKVASKKTEPDEGKAVNALGVTVAEVSAERRKELGIKQGVEITASGDGALARAGARNGDVIVRVGDADITSVRQFEELARNFPKNRAVAVFVRRANSTLVLPVRVGN